MQPLGKVLEQEASLGADYESSLGHAELRGWTRILATVALLSAPDSYLEAPLFMSRHCRAQCDATLAPCESSATNEAPPCLSGASVEGLSSNFAHSWLSAGHRRSGSACTCSPESTPRRLPVRQKPWRCNSAAIFERDVASRVGKAARKSSAVASRLRWTTWCRHRSACLSRHQPWSRSHLQAAWR